jgi:hypothetical protein
LVQTDRAGRDTTADVRNLQLLQETLQPPVLAALAMQGRDRDVTRLHELDRLVLPVQPVAISIDSQRDRHVAEEFDRLRDAVAAGQRDLMLGARAAHHHRDSHQVPSS